jgi:hypothetical protein
MSSAPKEVALRAVLVFGGTLVLALALLVPGILFVKLRHGAPALHCAGLFGGYVGLWALGVVGVLRLGRHDAVWGTAWGLCFFALLFLSWRL